MKKEHDQLKSLVLQRFERSEKWRKPWDEKWLRWYKLYRGIVPPLKDPDRSNLHIPYTYSTVDTVRSKLLSAVFATRPYIAFVPKDADDVENAEHMESLVDYQLEKGEIQTKFYGIITDMLIYGACPYEVGWRYETQTRKVRVPIVPEELADTGVVVGYDTAERLVVIWDDPDMQPFDIFDLYPDPQGASIDDCAWVIRRRWLTEADLREKVKQGIYKVKDWEELAAAANEISEAKKDRLAAIGAGEPETDHGDKEARRWELLEMWTDDRVVTLCNRAQIIRDQENPFDHGKKPFGLVKFDPLNGEFYGMSLVEVIEYLQAELNTTRNQRIDNASIAIANMWEVVRGANIDPADLVSRPNGIVWVDALGEQIRPLDRHGVDPSAFTEENIIKADIQEATATYAEARGAQASVGRTATEQAIRDKAVSLRFEVKLKLFESLGLKRLGMFYDLLNQQFIDAPRKLRTKTDTGEYKFDEITPESISGAYEYMPAGSAIEATLDALNHRNNMVILYDKLAQDPQIKQYELKKRVLESFGIKDVESLLKTDDEMAQEFVQQQQMILQQQGLLGSEMPAEQTSPLEPAEVPYEY